MRKRPSCTIFKTSRYKSSLTEDSTFINWLWYLFMIGNQWFCLFRTHSTSTGFFQSCLQRDKYSLPFHKLTRFQSCHNGYWESQVFWTGGGSDNLFSVDPHHHMNVTSTHLPPPRMRHKQTQCKIINTGIHIFLLPNPQMLTIGIMWGRTMLKSKAAKFK